MSALHLLSVLRDARLEGRDDAAEALLADELCPDFEHLGYRVPQVTHIDYAEGTITADWRWCRDLRRRPVRGRYGNLIRQTSSKWEARLRELYPPQLVPTLDRSHPLLSMLKRSR